MSKRTGGNKPRDTTTYFTPQKLEAMERFLETQTNIKSRNELLNVAVDYFMAKIEQSGGIVDGNGFPVSVADRQSHDAPHPQQLAAQKPVRRPQSA